MYLFEFENQEDEVDAVLAAAGRLEDLHSEGKLKNNWSMSQFVKWLNNYLAQVDSSVTVSEKEIFNMLSPENQNNPFKNVIDNANGEEVVFKGNQKADTPEPQSSENSQEVVGKMAKKAIGK